MSGLEDEDDAALAVRARGGEERAFTALMRRHKYAIHRLALRHCADADAANDIAQQSFVAAWSALDRYDPARPFLAWLRTIALNKARDHARRERVRRLAFGPRPSEEPPEPPSSAPDAEAETIGRAELARASKALAALPHGLKTPLILTAIEGLSMAEAGAVMGLTAKAVENRLYRARKALARVLEA